MKNEKEILMYEPSNELKYRVKEKVWGRWKPYSSREASEEYEIKCNNLFALFLKCMYLCTQKKIVTMKGIANNVWEVCQSFASKYDKGDPQCEKNYGPFFNYKNFCEKYMDGFVYRFKLNDDEFVYFLLPVEYEQTLYSSFFELKTEVHTLQISFN